MHNRCFVCGLLTHKMIQLHSSIIHKFACRCAKLRQCLAWGHWHWSGSTRAPTRCTFPISSPHCQQSSLPAIFWDIIIYLFMSWFFMLLPILTISRNIFLILDSSWLMSSKIPEMEGGWNKHIRFLIKNGTDTGFVIVPENVFNLYLFRINWS